MLKLSRTALAHLSKLFVAGKASFYLLSPLGNVFCSLEDHSQEMVIFRPKIGLLAEFASRKVAYTLPCTTNIESHSDELEVLTGPDS